MIPVWYLLSLRFLVIPEAKLRVAPSFIWCSPRARVSLRKRKGHPRVPRADPTNLNSSTYWPSPMASTQSSTQFSQHWIIKPVHGKLVLLLR